MQRWRKLIAGLALALWIALYAGAAVTLGNSLFNPHSSILWQTLYYLIAGFAWIPVCIPILRFSKHNP